MSPESLSRRYVPLRACRSKKEPLFAIVDDADYEAMSQYHWYIDGKGYATRNAIVAGKPKMLLMHREIMGTPAGVDTDHVNGDRLDNRRCNLRSCTRGQNNANRHARASATSKYKGVRKRTDLNRTKAWEARIRNDGKSRSLGYYLTEDEAAVAYDIAAKSIHREFANLNFPPTGGGNISG